MTTKHPPRNSTPAAKSPPARTDLPVHVLALLEHLDDTIFEAINGSAEALDQAADTWCAALSLLGQETIEESRQQYLRRAQTEWYQLKDQPGQPLHKTFAALEIIQLLSHYEMAR